MVNNTGIWIPSQNLGLEYLEEWNPGNDCKVYLIAFKLGPMFCNTIKCFRWIWMARRGVIAEWAWRKATEPTISVSGNRFWTETRTDKPTSTEDPIQRLETVLPYRKYVYCIVLCIVLYKCTHTA